MKKMALMILLLLCAMLMTACYQDRDPWPASGSYTQTEPDHTLIPRTTVTPVPTDVPAPTDTPASTDSPAPTDTPAPSPTPVPPADDDPPELPPWLPVLLILLLIAALCTLRLALCAPARAAARYRNPGDSLLIWYRATEEALICMGIPPLTSEAPATYLLRAQETLGGKVKLLDLGRALSAARYSRMRLKQKHTKIGARAYRGVLAMMTIGQKLKMYMRRVWFGMKLR